MNRRRRRVLLPWAVCALVAVVCVPTLAWGEGQSRPALSADAGFVARDGSESPYLWFQDAASSDVLDDEVTITAGGTVSFLFAEGQGQLPHNVKFNTVPTSCLQSAGIVYGAVPPLPTYPQPPGWAGECRFNTPGTYTFYCEAHPQMVGTVEVVAGTPTATPTPTPTATPTPTPTATPTATPTPTPTPTPTATATPTFTAPAAPAVMARDTSVPGRNWFQDVASGDPADNSVAVPSGSTVTFGFPSGAGTSVHNVKFSGAQPTACSGLPGVNAPAPAGWQGTCRYDQAGTYAFVCFVHPEMTGSVVVTPSAPPPASTATATATATPGPPAAATATPAATSVPTPVPQAKPAATLDKPESTKLKTFVKSGLKVSGKCTSGASGKVTLALSKANAKTLKLKGTTLATGTTKCTGGKLATTLKPTSAAKKALKRQKKALSTTLTLTVGTAKSAVKVTLK